MLRIRLAYSLTLGLWLLLAARESLTAMTANERVNFFSAGPARC